MAKKPVLTAKEAAAMIPDGATIMCGGFLACGQARAIVKELVALGTKDLTLIANDMGRAVGPKGEEFFGIAELIHNHQVKRVIATHVGMTPEVGQQHTEGTLEVNLLPQGTLAECIRAGGANALSQGALGQQIDLQSALGVLLADLGGHANVSGDNALDLMIVDQLRDTEELLTLGAHCAAHIVGD